MPHTNDLSLCNRSIQTSVVQSNTHFMIACIYDFMHQELRQGSAGWSFCSLWHWLRFQGIWLMEGLNGESSVASCTCLSPWLGWRVGWAEPEPLTRAPMLASPARRSQVIGLLTRIRALGDSYLRTKKWNLLVSWGLDQANVTISFLPFSTGRNNNWARHFQSKGTDTPLSPTSCWGKTQRTCSHFKYATSGKVTFPGQPHL